MKIEIDDDYADEIAIKALEMSHKFLLKIIGTPEEEPDDRKVLEAIDVLLTYYRARTP
jgi:hypothetical protein